MSEIIWHYHEMGNRAEYDRLLPAHMGITREEAFSEKLIEVAEKRYGEDYIWDAQEDVDTEELSKVGMCRIETDNAIRRALKANGMDDEKMWDEISALSHHAEGLVFGGGLYRVYADDLPQDTQWYVMVYQWRQVYRSPAEGGIWGTDEEFIKWTSFPTKEQAKKFVDEYNKLAVKKDKESRMYRGDSIELLGGDDTVSSVYPEGYIPTGWAAQRGTGAMMCVLPFMLEKEPWRYE